MVPCHHSNHLRLTRKSSSLPVRMHVCMYVYMYIKSCQCLCLCVCAYIYIYMYMYQALVGSLRKYKS